MLTLQPVQRSRVGVSWFLQKLNLNQPASEHGDGARSGPQDRALHRRCVPCLPLFGLVAPFVSRRLFPCLPRYERLTDRTRLCGIAWYLLSLITLWTNRYVVAEIRVDSNYLSLAQLGMSVVCGFASEIYLVGWGACKTGLKYATQNGLKDMLLLGGVRILTVMLGLTALKYIAVSFTRSYSLVFVWL